MMENEAHRVRINLSSQTLAKFSPMLILYWILHIFVIGIMLHMHYPMVDGFFNYQNMNEVIVWTLIHILLGILWYITRIKPGFIELDTISTENKELENVFM